jgi:hypothetical protein
MQFEKFALKLYVAEPEDLQLKAVTVAFHDFISSNALGELLIDTVDYTHVHDGPGIVLIGHASDYALDLSEGRPGLCCNRKRDHVPAPQRASDVLRRTLSAAAKLEARADVGLRFRTDELRLTVTDRLALGNVPDAFAAVTDAWVPMLQRVYGCEPSLIREQSGGQPLTVWARATCSASPAELLQRLD